MNPIERLRGVMHSNAAHNWHYCAYQIFAEAIFEFFDKTLPDSYESMIDTITDNFRVISHDDRLVAG